MTKRKSTAREKIELAVAYLNDGALHTAATLLTEAAAEIEKFATERDAYIEKRLGAKPKAEAEK